MNQRTKKKNSTEKKNQEPDNNEALLCRKVKESLLFLFLFLCIGCANYPLLDDSLDEEYSSQQGFVPQPTSYIDNGDETITDENGNIWQKHYKDNVTWFEADSYCKNLTLNNYKWRVPTPHELRTLIDYSSFDPAINVLMFPNTPSDWFWASKHSYFANVATQEDAAWIIHFYDGFIEYTFRGNKYCIRCIKE